MVTIVQVACISEVEWNMQKTSGDSQKPAGCFSCLHQSCPPDPCQRLPPFTCNDRHLRGTLTGNTCCHLPLNSLQTFHVLEIFCRSADVEVLLLPRKQYPIFKNVIIMTGKSSNQDTHVFILLPNEKQNCSLQHILKYLGAV